MGGAFKDAPVKPGGWTMGLVGFGECPPYHENQVALSKEKKDKWGLPQLVIDAEYRANELRMREQIKADEAEMLVASGFTNVKTFDNIGGLGIAIHEMGTARMGRDASGDLHRLPARARL